MRPNLRVDNWRRIEHPNLRVDISDDGKATVKREDGLLAEPPGALDL